MPAGYWLYPPNGTATSPDAGALPNDFTIIATVDGPIDTSVGRMIASQWEGDPNNQWYYRRFGSNGYPSMVFTATGNNADGVTWNPTGTAITNGTPQTLCICIVLDNGSGSTTVRGWYLNASGSWVMNSLVTQTKLVPKDTTSVIRIGGKGSSTSDRWDSRIYSVAMYYGSTGPAAVGALIWKFDVADAPGDGSLSFVDPRGRTWTLTAANAIQPDPPSPGQGPVAIWNK